MGMGVDSAVQKSELVRAGDGKGSARSALCYVALYNACMRGGCSQVVRARAPPVTAVRVAVHCGEASTSYLAIIPQ